MIMLYASKRGETGYGNFEYRGKTGYGRPSIKSCINACRRPGYEKI